MVSQFNFPTTVLFGEGSVAELAKRIVTQGLKQPLLVSDAGLKKIGILAKVSEALKSQGLNVTEFIDVHPNPIEDDVIAGASVYKEKNCDCVAALGGGSPMDAAKGIMIAATHDAPLAQYDDAVGGDKLITNPLPPLFAIATTAGTGSEVGRCGVIIVKETNNKTIFFHPDLLPEIAVLEPKLTVGLPEQITVATGLDALTHCLEAVLAPGFHPMADGIGYEGIRLIVENLDKVVADGNDLEARGNMLLAATMGATAFQKGLGMIHSLAHPLSSECGIHHGLANALVGPDCIEYIESQKLDAKQKKQIERVQDIFKEFGLAKASLSKTCRSYYASFGIDFGLAKHGVKAEQLDLLSKKAFADVCHQTNMVPVTTEQFKSVLEKSI